MNSYKQPPDLQEQEMTNMALYLGRLYFLSSYRHRSWESFNGDINSSNKIAYRRYSRTILSHTVVEMNI